MRIRVLLVGAAVLLGADCPHHGGVWESAATAAEPAAASCHGHPAESTPSGVEPPLALDCECPSCGFEHSVVSVGPGLPPPPTSVVAVLPAAQPLRSAPRPRGVWAPPPYPGFSEHTIVLQS